MDNANLFGSLIDEGLDAIKDAPNIQNILLGYAEACAKRDAGEELTMEDIGYVAGFVAMLEGVIEATKEEFADSFKLLEES